MIYGLKNRASTPMKPIVTAAYAGPDKADRASTINIKDADKKLIKNTLNKAA